jgi:hypothetical protein
VKVAPQLSSTVQNLASPGPEYGSDRTFGCVSTAVGRRAEVPWAGLYRLGPIHRVPLTQYSLDLSVRLHETSLDSTGKPQMDVSIWLRDLGLDNYAQAFQARL